MTRLVCTLRSNPEYSNGEFVEVWYEDFKRSGILERITSETGKEYPDIFKEGWTYPCTTSFDRDEAGMKFLYATMDAGENPYGSSLIRK